MRHRPSDYVGLLLLKISFPVAFMFFVKQTCKYTVAYGSTAAPFILSITD